MHASPASNSPRADMTSERSFRRVIVGTAGHIDHGKTRLVERLTGVRTDRLPEERLRGMTIDVGYAELCVEQGIEVGLLDVPGHKRLVRTMVAGATSMDVILLVVAADDGPMPQTREHLDVIDLLGVRRAVVALTKVDLVDASHAKSSERRVRRVLRGTSIASAPVVHVSSETGEGLEALRRTLIEAIPDTVAERDPRAFRMPILRAFAIPGRGTVVTGVPVGGRIVPGDAVEVLPAGWRARVRSLHVHHREVLDARAHHRTALLVPDLDADAVRRGMVVVEAGSLEPCPWIAASVRVLRGCLSPLEHGQLVRVHVGAADIRARLHVLNADRIPPGGVTAAALEGLEPFSTAPGDRFVLRSHNADETVGGGVVVSQLQAPLPRRKKGLVPSLLRLAEQIDDPDEVVQASIEDAGQQGVMRDQIAVQTGLRREVLDSICDRMVAGGRATRRGALLYAPSALTDLPERVARALAELHASDPARSAIAVSSLRAALDPMDRETLRSAIDALVARGTASRDERGDVALAGHVPDLPPVDQERCERLHRLFVEEPAKPPTEAESARWSRMSAADVRRALKLLRQCGRLLRVGDAHYDAEWLAWAKARLRALSDHGGGFTVSRANRALGTSRKYGVPLLEALDRIGFTRRTGDLRRVIDGE